MVLILQTLLSVFPSQEWNRRFTLVKVRRISDLSSATASAGQVKRARLPDTTLACLEGRVAKGNPMPTVEVVGTDLDGNVSVREVDRDELVKKVLWHVVGGLKGELFIELMEIMGRTGPKADTNLGP